jgi:hypothetical protein
VLSGAGDDPAHGVVEMRYDEYYELSERNGWRVTDLDWSALRADDAAGLISDTDRGALQGTAVIEHGVPHYAEVWSLVEGLRSHWELWQFTTLWTGEEHRHSYALKKACDQLALTAAIDDDLGAVATARFAELQKQSCVTDCYRTVPGMLTYAMIQELATHKFYALAAKRTASPFLRRLFSEIGADEMRHHVFYREALREGFEAATDRAGYLDRIVESTRAFKMPHLIYQLQVEFFEGGPWAIGAEIKAQLARCFSFDVGLLMRLAADNPVDGAASAA